MLDFFRRALRHVDAARMLRAALFSHRSLGFALISAGYMLAYFHRLAPAAISGDLQRALNASGASLGAVAGAYFYTYALVQIPTGVLVDTVGVRRVVALGAGLAALGTLLFGLSQSAFDAVVARVLVGLGIGVMFIALLKFNALSFHERHFATASGLSILIGNIGALLAGIPLAWIALRYGWRDVFVVLTFATLLLGLAVWAWVKEAPPDSKLRTEAWHVSLRAVITNRATWPALWPNLGIGGTLFAFNGLWAVPFLVDVHGVSRLAATLHVSIAICGFALGSLFVGVWSDRLRRRLPVMLLVMSVYVLVWLPLIMFEAMPRALTLSLFFLLGFGAAGFTLNWACVKEVNHPQRSGMAMSVVNIGAFVGAGILQPLIGAVMDASWEGRIAGGARIYAFEDYQRALGIFLLCSVAGWLGSTRMRETRCRNVYQDADPN